MRKFAAAAMVLLLATTVLAEAPFVDESFDAALKDAKEAKKVVMVDFYATWCGPCKQMDKETWPDAKVQKFLGERAVCLRVDAEKLTDLAAKYKIEAYPTILFVRSDGTEIDHLVGFRGPEQFIKDATAALSGKTMLDQAKEKAAAAPVDASVRMQLAEELARKGDNEGALKEYMWCYDHGLDNDPSFVGVRSSFLLMYVKQLAAKYPPAMDALRERQTMAEKALLDGKATDLVALDYVALSRELGATGNEIGVFDQLAKTGDATRATRAGLLPLVSDKLLAAKRYDDILATGAADPATVSEKIGRLNFAISYIKGQVKDLPPDQQELVLNQQRENLLKEFLPLYEALIGAGKLAPAAALAEQITKFDPSSGAYTLLADRARHVGSPAAMTVAAELGRQAAASANGSASQPSSAAPKL